MIIINKELCTGCGKCIADCISMSLFLRDNKAEHTIECIHCGHCVAICPANAVTIPEYDMEDVQELKSGSNVQIKSLLDTIRSRRSIRHYRTRQIEQEKLENIVQVGRYTATAVNRQACKFILVQDSLVTLKRMVWDGIEKAVSSGIDEAQPLKKLVDLRKAKGIDYLFRNAPAVLYIATENLWDAGLAAQNMELAAISQGLGALYNGYLVRSTQLSDEALALLQLDGKLLAVCMLLGYSDVKYVRTAPRKKADVVWL